MPLPRSVFAVQLIWSELDTMATRREGHVALANVVAKCDPLDFHVNVRVDRLLDGRVVEASCICRARTPASDSYAVSKLDRYDGGIARASTGS